MLGVRRDVWDKAFTSVEHLGAQIIEEKLAAEFEASESGPSTPDQTSNGSDTGAREDDVATDEAKKCILEEVMCLSDDDEVSNVSFCSYSSPLPPPPLLPTCFLVWHVFSPTQTPALTLSACMTCFCGRDVCFFASLIGGYGRSSLGQLRYCSTAANTPINPEGGAGGFAEIRGSPVPRSPYR